MFLFPVGGSTVFLSLRGRQRYDKHCSKLCVSALSEGKQKVTCRQRREKTGQTGEKKKTWVNRVKIRPLKNDTQKGTKTGTKMSRYQKCSLSLWYEKFDSSYFVKTWGKRKKSSYIILEDVPDGKWPRCCFCLRLCFVLLHLLQDTRGSTHQGHATVKTHRLGDYYHYQTWKCYFQFIWVKVDSRLKVF